MTAASIFTPENRLAKILNSLDGPTTEELLADANERVAEMSEAIRDYVTAKLEEILPYGALAEDVLFAESRALGAAALCVAEVAGAAGLGTIGEVSRGISAMVEGLKVSGIWHSEALRLHISTLRLLSEGEPPTLQESTVILRKLQALREALDLVD